MPYWLQYFIYFVIIVTLEVSRYQNERKKAKSHQSELPIENKAYQITAYYTYYHYCKYEDEHTNQLTDYLATLS